MLENILRHLDPRRDHQVIDETFRLEDVSRMRKIAYVALKPIVRGGTAGAAVGAMIGALTHAPLDYSIIAGHAIGSAADAYREFRMLLDYLNDLTAPPTNHPSAL